MKKQAALRAYRARRAAGADGLELLQATMEYAKGVEKRRTEKKFVMHGSTWFGPDEPWQDWVDGDPEPPAGRPKGAESVLDISDFRSRR